MSNNIFIETVCSATPLSGNQGWRRAPVQLGDRLAISAQVRNQSTGNLETVFLTVNSEENNRIEASRNSAQAATFVLVPDQSDKVGDFLHRQTQAFYVRVAGQEPLYLFYANGVARELLDIRATIEDLEVGDVEFTRKAARSIANRLQRAQADVVREPGVTYRFEQPHTLRALARQLLALKPWQESDNSSRLSQQYDAVRETIVDALTAAASSVAFQSTAPDGLYAVDRNEGTRLERGVPLLIDADLLIDSDDGGVAVDALGYAERRRFIKYGDRLRLHSVAVSPQPVTKQVLSCTYTVATGEQRCRLSFVDQFSSGTNLLSSFSFRCASNNGIRYFRLKQGTPLASLPWSVRNWATTYYGPIDFAQWPPYGSLIRRRRDPGRPRRTRRRRPVDCSNVRCAPDRCADGRRRRRIGNRCCACPADGNNDNDNDNDNNNNNAPSDCSDVVCTQDVCPDGRGRRKIGDRCCACPDSNDNNTDNNSDNDDDSNNDNNDNNNNNNGPVDCTLVLCENTCPDGRAPRKIGDNCCACRRARRASAERDPGFTINTGLEPSQTNLSVLLSDATANSIAAQESLRAGIAARKLVPVGVNAGGIASDALANTQDDKEDRLEAALRDITDPDVADEILSIESEEEQKSVTAPLDATTTTTTTTSNKQNSSSSIPVWQIAIFAAIGLILLALVLFFVARAVVARQVKASYANDADFERAQNLY